MAEPPRADAIDNPLERLELLAGDDEAVAAYLDSLDVTSPRERELLAELARSTPLADPAAFPAAHRRVVAALESLGRHGHHGSQRGRALGPLRPVVRYLVELVARFVVVSYMRQLSTDLRNLYWLRELESVDGSEEHKLLRAARLDGEGLVEIYGKRQLGLPSFLVGGALLSVLATAGRAAQGVALGSLWAAVATGLLGALIGVGGSWVILRGAALASRRIRRSTRPALETLWPTIGHCGRPPRDGSRRFALIGIGLTVGAWLVVPAVVALAFALA